MDKIVTVKNAHDYFGYRQISGDENSLNRIIQVPDINRPGLEFVGYYVHSDQRRAVLLGEKEISYIETMSQEDKARSFEYLTSDITPMILISRDLVCPSELLEIARKKNFPIFTSFATTTSLEVELESYLEEQMAKSTSIHGNLMIIHGIGTLIKGDSGIGKSEIALELLNHGHILVADDRVDIARIHNKIVGQCPEILEDLLEIRGIGIGSVVNLYGINSTKHKTHIDLVIDLVDWDQKGELTRIGNEEKEVEDFFGVEIQKITLPVRQGRSMATIIEAAVTNHIALKRGINSSKEFSKKVLAYLETNKE